MLLSPRASSVATAFSLRWFGGIAGPAVVFVLVAQARPERGQAGGRPVIAVIQLLLGALLLLLAGRRSRMRRREAATPKWMSGIETMTSVEAAGVGSLLGALNQKDVALAASAGVSIGKAGPSTGSLVLATAVFVVLAASTVGLPSLAFLLQPERLVGPLESLEKWLVESNATIMAVVLLVLGVAVLGEGVGNL